MKQKNDLLNEVKDKLSNRYYLEQRDQELVNDCVDELLKAINYSQCCKSDSEQFSFADMRDAFDYASVSSQRRDGMTFKEWMSKR